MPRRPFGSIRRLPSGRYQARYRNPAGHFVTAPRTFRTKGDAGLFLSTIEADLARGDWQDPRLARKTVREWADQWTATMTVRPNTRRGYETALRTHVLPAFADREVRTVTATDVARFVAEMLADGSAPGTVSGAKKVLRLVLNEAVRSDAIRRNPCDGVKVPRSRSDEMMFLSIGQVFDLAEAITHPAITRRTGGQNSYPEYGLLVRFAAFTGLRAGEIGALRIGRVDAGRCRVEVAEAVTEVSAELAPGGLVYDDPKTYERRSVPLVPSLATELDEHLRGRTNDPQAFVFTAPGGGPLRYQNFYNRHFKPAVHAAGLPVRTRFHDLRHTCASLLIAEGANPLTVKQRLGHSSITVTLDRYGHLFPELEEQVTTRFDASISAARHERAGHLRSA